MNITYKEDRAIISGEYIDVKTVFDCGQFFRFFEEDGVFHAIAADKLIYLENNGENLEIYPVKKADIDDFWSDFLRLDMSYSQIEERFSSDEILKKTVPICRGMRILHQGEFETLISFIISANNNIKRIKKIIEAICAAVGEKKIIGEREYFAFPTPDALSELSVEKLTECGAGYRAPYIRDTAKKIAQGFDLKCVYEMDYAQAKKYLCTLMGVGPKVADCILLFAYNKFDAFPVDTWVKKILKKLYSFEPKNNGQAVAFAQERFGQEAGIAQQYLFHYMRTVNNLQS